MQKTQEPVFLGIGAVAVLALLTALAAYLHHKWRVRADAKAVQAMKERIRTFKTFENALLFSEEYPSAAISRKLCSLAATAEQYSQTYQSFLGKEFPEEGELIELLFPEWDQEGRRALEYECGDRVSLLALVPYLRKDSLAHKEALEQLADMSSSFEQYMELLGHCGWYPELSSRVWNLALTHAETSMQYQELMSLE